MNRIKYFILGFLPIILVILFCYGWVENIIKINDTQFTSVTAVLALRFAGIFIMPLGAVLGFIS